MKRHLAPHRQACSFQACGLLGVASAYLFSTILAVYEGLSPLVMAGIFPVAISIFLALVMATKAVLDEEIIIYYHHEIAVLSGVALFLRILHQPVLRYLDITVLGLGLFLACGRIGCLLVGCCHGRPCRWGIRYKEEHAAAGFTHYYVGIRLFPVQALESMWALFIVAAGVPLVLRESAAGSVVAWYVIVYGAGRFFFEFLRGDPDRPYFAGFSEAQWISLILMSSTVYAEMSGSLPLRRWHASILALIICTMIAVSIHRHLRRTPTFQLFHPHHIREMAEVLAFADNLQAGSSIHIARTSLGINISGGKIGDGQTSHYALSCKPRIMSAEFAKQTAKIIVLLVHADCAEDLICGNNGVFHLLVVADSSTEVRSSFRSAAQFRHRSDALKLSS